MKKYGHTGTLFIKGGRYQWSYKHETCTCCKRVEFPHKGRGLCTSCWDKQRETPKRKEQKYKASNKWHNENYVRVTQRKKRKDFQNFDSKKYKKEWYQKNIEAIKLIAKAKRMRMRGEKVMEYRLGERTVYLPWGEWVEKPVGTSPKYNQWKSQYDQFNIIFNYYNRGNATTAE